VMNCNIYKVYPALKLTKDEVIKWVTWESAYNNFISFLEQNITYEPTEEMQKSYPVESRLQSNWKVNTALYHFEAANKMFMYQYFPYIERAKGKTELKDIYSLMDLFPNYKYNLR
jgi:hypothetical protein